jgi:REP element-mobilizing transposase RayT
VIKTTRLRVAHRTRDGIMHDALHLAMHAAGGLPSMRTPKARAVIVEAIRAQRGRFGFHVVQFAILSNHIHLIAEASTAKELGRGMKGLQVRISKGLNKLWEREGVVFPDRYFHRVVRKVHELRRLVRYVLQNARRHGVRVPDDRPDEYSSGMWFESWIGHLGRTFSSEPSPLERASRMELSCATGFVLELTERPTPAPPLRDPRRRRRLATLR